MEDKWEEGKNYMLKATVDKVMLKIQQREDAEKKNQVIVKMKESEKNSGKKREIEGIERYHELFIQYLGAEEQNYKGWGERRRAELGQSWSDLRTKK